MTGIGWFDLTLGTGLIAGAAAAAAALYGRYRELPALLTGPTICRTEASGCQVLFRSPNAALLGVPNSLLALLFYPALAVGLAAGWPEPILAAGATAALAMSVRLGAGLIRRRLECRICWTGHIANFLIWIALAVRVVQGVIAA